MYLNVKGVKKMIVYDSEENILNTLRKWKLEMNSPYNDGWVQQGFKEKLLKVKDFFRDKHLDSALEDLSCGSKVGEFEDELELYETYGGD